MQRRGRELMNLSHAERALLEFKPRVPYLSDDQWLLLADVEGITNALVRCFWHWWQSLHTTGEREPVPDIAKEILECLFGVAGYVTYRMAQDTPAVFYRLVTSKEWSLGELGEFGEWLHYAELEAHSSNLLKAILLSMPAFSEP